jgi:predicted dehydrogenase
MDATASTDAAAENGRKYRVGILGTGRPHNTEGSTGWGMAGMHADGYNKTGRCEIVALCDIVEEKARQFSDEHAGGKAQVFTDYERMLAEVPDLDFVSVCTIPALHAPMVIAAAQAKVRAIHCEKPMAPTWGESRRMAEACAANGVLLTFNHQRRFLQPFQEARRLIREGAIGRVVRLEGACGDMFDWGTHWMNMFLFYNDETPAEWVMGQIDARRPRNVFRVPMETQGVCVARFTNGVTGTLYTGEGSRDAVGCANRIIGTDGWIEVHDEKPHVRIRAKSDAEPRAVEGITENLHGNDAIPRAIADLVDCLGTGRKPLLDVSNALPTTEILFAAYESARRRGRIDLPLDIDDHPLAGMVAAGVFPGFPIDDLPASLGGKA